MPVRGNHGDAVTITVDDRIVDSRGAFAWIFMYNRSMVASVSNITSASSTVQYFEKDGYYSKNDPEHRKASCWVGQGAVQLGLTGHIDPDRFRSVLNGYVPETDIRLGRIRDGEHEHRAGIDLTLSAPKSVSLEALVHGNDLVQSAHDAAMRVTLDFVEKRIVQTMVWSRTKKKMERVHAPALVAATFRHAASRNLDPQLHTHCVIVNMTHDTNGKWRSIELPDLMRNNKLIGAFYRNELARQLRQLGFALAPTMIGHVPGFEIAGHDRVALEAFSSRRRDILDYIAEKGWEYNAARTRQAALATRLGKDEPHWEILTDRWRQRAKELGIEKISRTPIRETVPVQSPLEIVWQAAEHLEERPPVFAQRDLATRALGHAAGRHTITNIDAATERMHTDGHLIAGTRHNIGASFVTDRTLRAQKEVVSGMREGAGATVPLVTGDVVEARLDSAGLTISQRDAVRIILASSDRVVGVQVYAGMGKMEMLRQMMELAKGKLIIGLSPSVSVMRELARETGIACRTLQGFLANYRDVVDNLVGGEQLAGLRKDFAGSILVVDDMAQVSTEQARRLIVIADRLGVGRLALVGDRKQLRAVGAGQPFPQLRDAGMQTALMDDIRRQRNPGLKATALDVIGSAPKPEPSPSPGKSGENLYQVPADELGEIAARIWLELLPESRSRTAILAPTRALRERINETVREGFEEEGTLHGREIVIETLVGLGLTQAQKEDIRNWHEGDIAVFHNDFSRNRIRADDTCTVTAVKRERVWLHHPDGKPRHISPADSVHYRLELCEAAPVRIRAGDRIRWTRNDNARRLAHGKQAVILTIKHNYLLVRTDNRRTLKFQHNDPQLRYIEHAYAWPIDAELELELELEPKPKPKPKPKPEPERIDVIVALDSGHGRLNDQQMFYWKIRRKRENAVVLTDNHEQLVALQNDLSMDMDMGM